MSRVMVRTLVDGRFGRANGGTDPHAIDTELEDPAIGPHPEEWDWWVTIACERGQSVPDDEWTQRPFLWLEWATAEKIAAHAQSEAGQGIDHIAAIIASGVTNAMRSGPVLDRVIFRARRRRPFILPTFGMRGVTVSAGSPTAFDARSLRPLFQNARVSHNRLRSAAYWWARALEESDERKRFLFGFLVLKILANTLAPIAHAAVSPTLTAADGVVVDAPDGVVMPMKRVPLAVKFQLMAAYLGRDDAAEDTAGFIRLKKARDEVAHGRALLTKELPHREAARLVNKYMSLAIAHKLKPHDARSGDLGRETGARTRLRASAKSATVVRYSSGYPPCSSHSRGASASGFPTARYYVPVPDVQQPSWPTLRNPAPDQLLAGEPRGCSVCHGRDSWPGQLLVAEVSTRRRSRASARATLNASRSASPRFHAGPDVGLVGEVLPRCSGTVRWTRLRRGRGARARRRRDLGEARGPDTHAGPGHDPGTSRDGEDDVVLGVAPRRCPPVLRAQRLPILAHCLEAVEREGTDDRTGRIGVQNDTGDVHAPLGRSAPRSRPACSGRSPPQARRSATRGRWWRGRR